MRYSGDTLYEALITDTWPDSVAALTDYGLDQPNKVEVYAAMQAKVKSGEVTLEQLRSAAGNGDALTRLFGVPVSTDW